MTLPDKIGSEGELEDLLSEPTDEGRWPRSPASNPTS